MSGGADKTPFTFSISEAFDLAREQYQEAQDEWEKLQKSPEDYDLSAVSDKLSTSAQNYNTVLADVATNLEAVTDPETGKALKGYEDTYTELRDIMNRAEVFRSSEEEFLSSLINRTQYKDIRNALGDMAQEGADADALVKQMQNYPDLAEIILGAGIEGGLHRLAEMFVEAANGTGEAISLVEDNLDDMNSAVSAAEKNRATISGAITESFGVGGLSLESYSALRGLGYMSAMRATDTGISLDYRKYQALREKNANEEKYRLQQEIDDNLAEIKRLEEAKRLATDSQSIARYDQQLGIARQNVESARMAYSQVSGQYSDVMNFVESLASGYSVAATTDSIASGVASVQELVKQGRVSDAPVREFMQLFTDRDISGLTNADIAKNYEEVLGVAKQFMTLDDEGNVTGFSQDKFISQLKGASENLLGNPQFLDESLKTLTLNSSDIANLAKYWGISRDAVIEMASALGAYGYDVTITDTSHSLAELTQNADGAGGAIEKLNAESSKYLHTKWDDDTVALKEVNQLTKENVGLQLDTIENARELATAAGDTEALEQLNQAYAATLLRRKELNRSAETSGLMGLDPTEMIGEAGELVSAIQSVQTATDELAVGKSLSNAGVDIDVETLAGNLSMAQEELAGIILGDADFGAKFGELIGKDISGMSVDDIIAQLPQIPSDQLFDAFFPDGVLGVKNAKIDAANREANERRRYLAEREDAAKPQEEVAVDPAAEISGTVSDMNGQLGSIDSSVSAIAASVAGENTEEDILAEKNAEIEAQNRENSERLRVEMEKERQRQIEQEREQARQVALDRNTGIAQMIPEVAQFLGQNRLFGNDPYIAATQIYDQFGALSGSGLSSALSELYKLPSALDDASDSAQRLSKSTDDISDSASSATAAQEQFAMVQSLGQGVLTPESDTSDLADRINGDKGEITKPVIFEPETEALEAAEAEAETPVEQPVEQTIVQRVQRVLESGNLDTSGIIEDREAYNQAVNFIVSVTGDTAALEELKASEGGEYDQLVTATANAIGQEDVDALNQAVGALSDKSVREVAYVYGTDSVWGLVGAINSLSDRTVTTTHNVVTNHITNGVPYRTSKMFGTASFSGSAYARGSWGTRTTQHNVLTGK